jgi:hypothetical protein
MVDEDPDLGGHHRAGSKHGCAVEQATAQRRRACLFTRKR